MEFAAATRRNSFVNPDRANRFKLNLNPLRVMSLFRPPESGVVRRSCSGDSVSHKTGLGTLVDEWVNLPGCFNANGGIKVSALVMTTLTGAESIDGLAAHRHGAPRTLFTGAP